jgi:glycerol-3-phosphate dehydrogenase
VVNATGVWVDALRRLALPPDKASTLAPLVRPSQGVHLVVARETLPLTEAVLVPRTSDGRVLFAVPWLGATVIGTTDTPREDAPLEPRPLPEELAFLLGETERALGVRLPPEAVRSVWVGLRPLVGGAGAHTRELSREHLIRREAPGLLTVTGGKWTTYRAMAEQVLQALRAQADLPPAPRAVDTAQTPLWGTPDARLPRVSLQAPPGPHLLGTAADALADLPGHAVALGLGLTEAIVRYSARHEWAVTVEDMLARRWRVLFLDARLAEQLAPRVAALLQQETGLDPQLEPFLALCRQYRLPGADGSGASPTLENAS